MHRSIKIGLSALLLLATSSRTFADNTIEAFRTAPVWYVQYEVSFKVAFHSTGTLNDAPTSCNIKMDRTFSAISLLDIRSDGPSPVLGTSALSGAADGSTPSVEEQLKMTENLMARMETAANWMSGGMASYVDENVSEENAQAAGAAAMNKLMGPASLDYLRVNICDRVINELGQSFKQNDRTTRKGSGMVLPGGGAGITFEVDAAAKKYALVLPIGFNEMTAMMTTDVVRTLTDMAGKNPSETKQHNEGGLGLFPSQITLDDPKNLQAGMAFIKGDINPATGNITGERTMAAHYMDDGVTSIPGTFTFRYTLTRTPPATVK